jgi:hypothetical protein
LGIPGQLTARSGKHQVHMAADQLGEGGFVLGGHISPDQIVGINFVAHLPDRNRCSAKADKEFVVGRCDSTRVRVNPLDGTFGSMPGLGCENSPLEFCGSSVIDSA